MTSISMSQLPNSGPAVAFLIFVTLDVLYLPRRDFRLVDGTLALSRAHLSPRAGRRRRFPGLLYPSC